MELQRTYLRAKKTGEIYSTVDGLTYYNHTTQKSGQISPEIAKQYLTINLSLNAMIEANNELLKLIELGMVIDNEKNEKL